MTAPGSTARQIFNTSSTLLDSSTARQTSTDLDAQAHRACSQARQARQLLDSYLTGSTGKALTAPRQRPRQRLDGATLDSSTARQPGLNGRRCGAVELDTFILDRTPRRMQSGPGSVEVCRGLSRSVDTSCRAIPSSSLSSCRVSCLSKLSQVVQVFYKYRIASVPDFPCRVSCRVSPVELRSRPCRGQASRTTDERAHAATLARCAERRESSRVRIQSARTRSGCRTGTLLHTHTPRVTRASDHAHTAPSNSSLEYCTLKLQNSLT